MNWKKLSSEYISKHPYFTARKDVCQTPGGKMVESYYVVELPTTVCALAITEEGNVLMERQYRHPLEETIIELPGAFLILAKNLWLLLSVSFWKKQGMNFLLLNV